VGQLKYEDTVITVGDGQVGPLAHKFFDAIQDIQYGAIEGPAGWIEPVA
jgi:branched-chain amino acid aminotransferase